jgi:DNA-binding IclR family transcriptional regulator
MKRRERWTFLSNHSHVLIALAKQPDLRIRDLAQAVGITERAVAQILSDLQAARVLTKRRVGRRNVYLVDANAPLRHAVESHRTVADILRLAEGAPASTTRQERRSNTSAHKSGKRAG